MTLLVFLLVHSQRLIDIPKPFAPNAPNTKALHDTGALSAHEQQKADRHRKRPPVRKRERERERERETLLKKTISSTWFVLRVQGIEKSITEATETQREEEDEKKGGGEGGEDRGGETAEIKMLKFTTNPIIMDIMRTEATEPSLRSITRRLCRRTSALTRHRDTPAILVSLDHQKYNYHLILSKVLTQLIILVTTISV